MSALGTLPAFDLGSFGNFLNTSSSGGISNPITVQGPNGPQTITPNAQGQYPDVFGNILSGTSDALSQAASNTLGTLGKGYGAAYSSTTQLLGINLSRWVSIVIGIGLIIGGVLMFRQTQVVISSAGRVAASAAKVAAAA